MKQRKLRKVLAVQDCGAFPVTVIVVHGHTKRELDAFAKKVLVKKSYDWVRDFVDFDDVESGKMCAQTHYNAGMVVLHLGMSVDDAWDTWQTLIHEVVHVVQQIRIVTAMEMEREAEAYTSEYLFKNIRRKLMGI
ncbi:MAG: hypothetical protein KBD24_04465 [Candidatus Pacebacteria bacterium]|nr:hypothetical protein [Candidatus Paceibacterota bacterium]